jgi:hypothetical protein
MDVQGHHNNPQENCMHQHKIDRVFHNKKTIHYQIFKS